MPARTVLLVDDSDAVRLTLAALLEDDGHRVVEAASLAEARAWLSSAAAGEVDVAIVDLHLSDGLGTLLFEQVRASQPAAALVLLSGADLGAPIEGVDLSLEKGAAPDGVGAMLERAIASRQARG